MKENEEEVDEEQIPDCNDPSPPLDKGEINRGDLTMQSKLDGGRFVDVWKGKYKGKTSVAIREMKGGTITGYLSLLASP